MYTKVWLVLMAFFYVACGGDTPTTPSPSQSPDTVVSPGESTASPFFQLRDLETGSLWNIKGEAIEGPFKGQALTPFPTYNAYWFAWSSFWPNTSVWNEIQNGGQLHSQAFKAIPTDEIVPDVPPDNIPPLDEPPQGFGSTEFVTAKNATHVRDDEIVIGIVLNGDVRAYPVGIMNYHEIVNHTVGNIKVSATYCPLTASGILFDADQIDFGNTGALYNNNMVMYDRETNSFWSQMGLNSIAGARAGARLTHLPVTQTTWATWKALYPDTQILTENTGYRRNYRNDFYIQSGYTQNNTVMFPQEAQFDQKFHPKTMTLGLIGQTSTRAYLYASLAPRRVLNHTFENTPILIVYDHNRVLALSYNRTLNNQTLTFEIVE